MMVARSAASLALRTPLLIVGARSPANSAATFPRFASASRTFSIAASASPRIVSAKTSSAFPRSAPVQSRLVGGQPFSRTVASRGLSLWPFSGSSSQPRGTSSLSSELDTKKDQAANAAHDLHNSTEAKLQDASSSASDHLHNAQSAASDAAHTAQSKATEFASEVSDKLSHVDPSFTTTATESFAGAAGVKAGELTELGLNHWSSPVGWLTNLLEFVGTHTGLPWWGTIVATTLLLRLLISPAHLGGQKNAIRLANIQPEMKRNMDDIKHFKAAGDQMQMQKAVLATQKLIRDNNASPFGSLKPIAIQLPLMFCFYLALNRIATAGAESFAHGGPFWTPDLTVTDPTWILPAVSTLATFAVAELGFKVGTTTQTDPAQQQMMKYIFRGFMPILGYISSTFPSGVLVYWATTNLFSLAQLAVLQIPIVRQWAKFPKRIEHPKNPYTAEQKGFMDKLKAARDSLSDSSKPAVAKPVQKSSTATRSDALKEILDDKAAYEASSAGADKEAVAAQRNRDRVLKARQRRARQ